MPPGVSTLLRSLVWRRGIPGVGARFGGFLFLHLGAFADGPANWLPG